MGSDRYEQLAETQGHNGDLGAWEPAKGEAGAAAQNTAASKQVLVEITVVVVGSIQRVMLIVSPGGTWAPTAGMRFDQSR